MAYLIEPALIAGLFIVTAVGGLIVYELRQIHRRIDKYAEKMDSHIKDDVKIQMTLAGFRKDIDWVIKERKIK